MNNDENFSIKKSLVRTRYAPSPTGYMHVGNLRSALYTYLFAKQNGGKFILRIEDTDQSRFVPDSLEVIYESLRLTGLHWDEGPDVGGEFGPYIQSLRKTKYQEVAQKLMDTGRGYPCFCSKDLVGEIKKNLVDDDSVPIAAYDGRCARLGQRERQDRLQSGQPFVVRQKIDHQGETRFHDIVYGEISIKNEQLDDQVLIKADGFPTYNFANVVDDHFMGITHVMRGSEYLSSTPKYILLYQALDWIPPQTIHLPLIHNSSGKKLSKRDGAVALSEFLSLGYLPEGLLNYVALLGWSPGDNTEFFKLADLVLKFDIHRIQRSPAVFDEVKLSHINGLHIKSLALDQFHRLATPFYPAEVKSRFDLLKISPLLQSRIGTFTDIGPMVEFLWKFPFPYDLQLFVHKKMKTTIELSAELLGEVKSFLESVSPFSSEKLYEALNAFCTEKGMKASQVLWPLRVALTGLPSTPGGATEVAEILGRDETLVRIEKSLELISRSVNSDEPRIP